MQDNQTMCHRVEIFKFEPESFYDARPTLGSVSFSKANSVCFWYVNGNVPLSFQARGTSCGRSHRNGEFFCRIFFRAVRVLLRRYDTWKRSQMGWAWIGSRRTTRRYRPRGPLPPPRPPGTFSPGPRRPRRPPWKRERGRTILGSPSLACLLRFLLQFLIFQLCSVHWWWLSFRIRSPDFFLFFALPHGKNLIYLNLITIITVIVSLGTSRPPSLWFYIFNSNYLYSNIFDVMWCEEMEVIFARRGAPPGLEGSGGSDPFVRTRTPLIIHRTAKLVSAMNEKNLRPNMERRFFPFWSDRGEIRRKCSAAVSQPRSGCRNRFGRVSVRNISRKRSILIS